MKEKEKPINNRSKGKKKFRNKKWKEKKKSKD